MQTYAFHVRHKNGWGSGFGPRPTHCHECRQELPVPQDTGTMGYGCGPSETIASHLDAPPLKPGESLEQAPAICYSCCAEQDKASMIATGKATLYLTRTSHGDDASPIWHVTNWPGSLRYYASVRKGAHNLARWRYDAWFTGPDNATWHGVTYGDNTEICRCRRTKQKQ
jgi:hypothetical protein